VQFKVSFEVFSSKLIWGGGTQLAN